MKTEGQLVRSCLSAKELSKEYKALLQSSNYSHSDSERISEILALALSDSCLDRLIRKADGELADEQRFSESYLQNQKAKTIDYLNHIDSCT